MHLNGSEISLKSFCDAVASPVKLLPNDHVISKIKSAHETVLEHVADDLPIYGLNTGLGSNLGHRLKPEEISDFQLQIIAGRAIACGDPLPENTGRGVLLARIISAANGYSGISVRLFKYLIAVYETGLSPTIPEYGSIGDSDLVQNAHMGLAIMGKGEFWRDGTIVDSERALSEAGLKPPILQPKEGLILVSHSGLTVTRVALSLQDASHSIEMAKSATVLSYAGYGANQNIHDERIHTLRMAPGQAEAALWFRDALKGSEHKPRRVQEALSYRTVAPAFGASQHAFESAISVWEHELNGSSDSPVVLDNGEMLSTVNFQSPALALAIATLSQSLVTIAIGAVQRMQKMMNAELSDLPAYLSPVGAASAGFAPSQKTASVLLAEIRHEANPVHLNLVPMSNGVEDMASMTPLAATKLQQLIKPFKLLSGLEALVACQAIDLRKPEKMSLLTGMLHGLIRGKIPMMKEDRALGEDINTCTEILSNAIESAARGSR